MRREIPTDRHVTYELQRRTCGKANCATCRAGTGHGPYWYAYWREGKKLVSAYVGKDSPLLRRGLAAMRGASA